MGSTKKLKWSSNDSLKNIFKLPYNVFEYSNEVLWHCIICDNYFLNRKSAHIHSKKCNSKIETKDTEQHNISDGVHGKGNLINKGSKLRLNLIYNGNVKPPLEYNNIMYKAKNTCSFDSVIVGIAVAYIDYPVYKLYVDKTNNAFLNMAKNLALNIKQQSIYEKRITLLKQHFDLKDDEQDLKIIKTECNVSKIICDYLNNTPSSLQLIECTKKCTSRIVHSSPTVILDDNGFTSFSNLKNMLVSYIKTKYRECYKMKCNGRVKTHRTLQSAIFIETDMFSDSSYKHKLIDFPEKIVINKNKYILVSIIHMEDEHYIAYIRRKTGQWEVHNDQNLCIEEINIKNSINVNPHLLMYIKL